MKKKPPMHHNQLASKEFTIQKTDYMEKDESGNWKIKVKKHDTLFMPVDCPVYGIGTDATNSNYYYLTATGKVITLTANNHNKQGIMRAFDIHADYLLSRFAKFKIKKGTEKRKDEAGNSAVQYEHDPNNFEVNEIARLMMADASRFVVQIHEIVRKIGCWKSDEGLIIHHGDCFTEFNHCRKSEPITRGLHKYQNFAYIRWDGGDLLDRDDDDNLIIPDIDFKEAKMLAHEMKYDIIGSWNWKNEILDPQLFFGMLMVGYFGGYLKWRSSCWIQGLAGTGKSTLNDLVENIYNGACYRAVNPTPPSARNKISSTTIPVMLDEQTNIDPIKEAGIHDLMRFGSSGGSVTTATNDGGMLYYPILSSFMMTGINLPELDEQDLSRLTIFHLNPLDPDKEPLDDDDFEKARESSEKLRYFIARNIFEFAERIEYIREWLKSQKIDARGQDQLAAPIVFSNWFAFDEIKPSYDMLNDYWKGLLNKHTLHQDEKDWENCLNFITTNHIPFENRAHNETMQKMMIPVKDVIHGAIYGRLDDYSSNATNTESQRIEQSKEKYLETLQKAGLNIMTKINEQDIVTKYLFIPNHNAQIANLYRGTAYVTPQKQLWKSHLRGCPGALTDKIRYRIGKGNPVFGTAIPLTHIIGMNDE